MKKLLVTLLFCITAFSVQAGLMVEPYLGLSISGAGDVQVGSGSVQNHSYTALSYGGRVGYQMLGLMGGIEYSLQANKVDTTGQVTPTTFDRNQFGVFIGYNLPILFRVWGTYYLSGSASVSNTVDLTSRFATGDKLESGSGYALGAGFTGLPFLSLNVEYRTMSYTTWKKSSGAIVSSVTNTNDFHEILLSVSMPLSIPFL